MQPVTVNGTVTKFKGNGRKLGYPTANLTTENDLVDGVYFGHANLAQYENHPAIIFVGEPSTLGDHVHRVEVYLLDIPDIDYYGEAIVATAEYYHRPNQTFDSVDLLLEEMAKDEVAARQWFRAANSGNTQT